MPSTLEENGAETPLLGRADLVKSDPKESFMKVCVFLKFFEKPDSPQGEKTICWTGRRSILGPFLFSINGDTRSL